MLILFSKHVILKGMNHLFEVGSWYVTNLELALYTSLMLHWSGDSVLLFPGC